MKTWECWLLKKLLNFVSRHIGRSKEILRSDTHEIGKLEKTIYCAKEIL